MGDTPRLPAADAVGMKHFAALVASVAAVLAVVPAAVAAPASTGAIAAHDAIELPIVAELNRVRASHGLRPLRTAQPLRVAADAHAGSMARGGYFSHTSADGTSFGTRIARYYKGAGYRSWSAGENLLWSAGVELTAREAVRLWMGSPPHRKNILTAAWREIGISAVRAQGATGVFGGSDVTIVVTEFGVRS